MNLSRGQVPDRNQIDLSIIGVITPNPIHFLSDPPERKPNQKKELENVLSSEAVTQILQITQRTRYAQTAFRISLLRLRFRNPRLNNDSKNLHSSKALFVRNVFNKQRDVLALANF